MPYRIRNNCVQKQGASGWENVKCHDTRSDAVDHLRAIKANVKEGQELVKSDLKHHYKDKEKDKKK